MCWKHFWYTYLSSGQNKQGESVPVYILLWVPGFFYDSIQQFSAPAYRHWLTNFSTMTISVQIRRSGHANISKTFISICKLKNIQNIHVRFREWRFYPPMTDQTESRLVLLSVNSGSISASCLSLGMRSLYSLVLGLLLPPALVGYWNFCPVNIFLRVPQVPNRSVISRVLFSFTL